MKINRLLVRNPFRAGLSSGSSNTAEAAWKYRLDDMSNKL